MTSTWCGFIQGLKLGLIGILLCNRESVMVEIDQGASNRVRTYSVSGKVQRCALHSCINGKDHTKADQHGKNDPEV